MNLLRNWTQRSRLLNWIWYLPVGLSKSLMLFLFYLHIIVVYELLTYAKIA